MVQSHFAPRGPQYRPPRVQSSITSLDDQEASLGPAPGDSSRSGVCILVSSDVRPASQGYLSSNFLRIKPSIFSVVLAGSQGNAKA
jgi:hypothetical protein